MREGWLQHHRELRRVRPAAAASAAPMTTSSLEDPVAQRLFPWPRGPVGQSIARAFARPRGPHRAPDGRHRRGAERRLRPARPPRRGPRCARYRLRAIAKRPRVRGRSPGLAAAQLRFARELALRARSIDHLPRTSCTMTSRRCSPTRDTTRGAPTAWIIEGVAVYLPATVTSRLLDVVRARVGASSALALTYIGRHAPRSRGGWAVFSSARSGEPLGRRSRRTRSGAPPAAGLEVESDTNDVDWCARIWRPSRLAWPATSDCDQSRSVGIMPTARGRRSTRRAGRRGSRRRAR